MTSRTSPRDNSSPPDPPARPSRALPAPLIDLGARGLAEIDDNDCDGVTNNDIDDDGNSATDDDVDYDDQDGATDDEVDDDDGDGVMADNIEEDCDGATDDEVDDDGDGATGGCHRLDA